VEASVPAIGKSAPFRQFATVGDGIFSTESGVTPIPRQGARSKRWRDVSQAAPKLAKRLECVRLTGAVEWLGNDLSDESGSKLHALQTLPRHREHRPDLAKRP